MPSLKLIASSAMLAYTNARAELFFFNPNQNYLDQYVPDQVYLWEQPQQYFIREFVNTPKHQNTPKQSGDLYRLLKSHPERMETNDKLLDALLISKRGYHHLLYDEVIALMAKIENDFGNILTLESIGKSYEKRDIMMIKIDATNFFQQRGIQTNPDKKALLMTGAHHSRELISVQMPLYIVLDLLHGLVHEDPETIEILKRNQIFTIPFVNVDGSHKIYEHWMQTGELLLKRKNNDRRFENGANCPLAYQGVDINRNYGYLWGNNLGPCSESFAGPHAFSEPETKAMRAMLYKYVDTIKFVYNFHAFGPMYIWPYNGEIENELATSNPEAQRIFNEIYDAKLFPETTLPGNAINTVGYKADGEANDYILKTFDIPSVSPELGNDNVFSGQFFLPYDFVTREVLRDNYPWIKYTIEKLGGELSIRNKTASVESKGEDYVFSFELKNTGLQDWNLADEGYTFKIQEGDVDFVVGLPNLQAREIKTIQFTVPGFAVQWDQNDQVVLDVNYSKLAVKPNEIVKESITFKKPSAPSTKAASSSLMNLIQTYFL